MGYKPTRLERKRIDNYASVMEIHDGYTIVMKDTDEKFFKEVKRRVSRGYDSQADFKADADECDRRYMAYRETLKKRR